MIFLRIRSLSRKIALLLILALLCLSCAALAEDSKPQYAATKDFVAVLEANDLKYSYKGIDDDTDENIRVSFSDDDYDSIVLNVFFSKDSDAVYIRGWNLLTASAGTNYVLSINTSNSPSMNLTTPSTCRWTATSAPIIPATWPTA